MSNETHEDIINGIRSRRRMFATACGNDLREMLRRARQSAVDAGFKFANIKPILRTDVVFSY